nr:hypothetical protein [uncultured Prevotella sp.]
MRLSESNAKLASPLPSVSKVNDVNLEPQCASWKAWSSERRAMHASALPSRDKARYSPLDLWSLGSSKNG